MADGDFDLAGNRTSETLNGVTRTFGYNAANQMISHGSQTLTYDRNGNLLNDGSNGHVWDRANRLKSMVGLSYDYSDRGWSFYIAPSASISTGASAHYSECIY